MYREIGTEEIKLHSRLGYNYFMDRAHPLATTNGFVYYHRHVASLSVGRWLTTEEHVHHLDGDKTNNSIDNLEVLSAAEHAWAHGEKLGLGICKRCHTSYNMTYRAQQYCGSTCQAMAQIKNNDITRQELQEQIDSGCTWVSLGRKYGYSDNGIKKRAKALGCNVPKKYKPR